MHKKGIKYDFLSSKEHKENILQYTFKSFHSEVNGVFQVQIW